MQIYSSKTCTHKHKLGPSTPSGKSPFCELGVDNASRMLALNSQIDHSAFCLAYVFTYRRFRDGRTLGLAWVAGASPSRQLHLLCELQSV